MVSFAGSSAAAGRLNTGDGYWYKDTINGQTVGLTTTRTGDSYVLAPPGEASTGAVVVINGQKTNLVIGSDLNYWCNSGVSWQMCNENAGKYDNSFVRTDLYRTASLLSPRVVGTDDPSIPRSLAPSVPSSLACPPRASRRRSTAALPLLLCVIKIEGIDRSAGADGLRSVCKLERHLHHRHEANG